MSPDKTLPGADATEEVAALIATLHETGQRLEELTAGEVDSVADHEGQTFVLRRAQEFLRHSEALKQAAILNALPAHIAMLDSHGVVMTVNDVWRHSACTNTVLGPGHALGLNYLEICDSATGVGASDAHHVAEGIRALLSGQTDSVSIEYSCVTPTEDRWYMMTATPVGAGRPNGVVIMHVDVTAERRTEESLRASEARFRQMAEHIRDVFFLLDADTNRMLYISPAYEEIWGRSCESLYANPESWTDAIHPDDKAATYEKYRLGMAAGTFEYEHRIMRPDGSIRWMAVRGFPVRDDVGKLERIAGIVSDITERKAADEVLAKRAAELERFHRLSVGREMQMIELKKQVNELAEKAGQELPYALSFLGGKAR